MSEDQLLGLREKIDSLLPVTALEDMNLERELVLQHRKVSALQDRVLEDRDVPANQKSQVSTACSTALERLVKLQSSIYDSERQKQIEQVLLKVIKTLPLEKTEEFLNAYEKLGKKLTK